MALTPDGFDCCGGSGDLMTVDEVLTLLAERILPVEEVETIPLRQALGRVLAQDVVSPIDVPGFDNSAMDGWAVFTADLSPTVSVRLPIGGRIAAGHPLAEPARPGFAYRIFTGAPVPAGPDAVVMQEDCREHDGHVILPPAPKRGANIRKAGESVAKGGIPLTAGTRLSPQHLGVAATLGLTEVTVRHELRVAIFSTGDELREPGQPLEPGAIYDANRYTLSGLLQHFAVPFDDLGLLPDDPDAIQDALAEAALEHDLILTSGGVSVGEEDHVKGAVTALGSLHLWRIAMKPGKPLALGQVRGIPFLGLPGNPVAVFLGFLMFAKPLLGHLSGATVTPPRRFPLPAAFSLKKKAGRREFPRARLTPSAFGTVVELHRSDSSGVLTSVSSCDGIVEIGEQAVEIAPGDLVDFIPFTELLA